MDHTNASTEPDFQEEEEQQQQQEEQEHEEDHDDSDSNPDDDFDYIYRMGLSNEEHQWALRIKEIVTSTPSLQSPPISDMMIAQMALVSMEDEEEGDMDKARGRLERLQAVRTKYGMVESIDSANDVLQRFVCDLCPGSFLSFYLHPQEETYVMVVDLTCANPELFNDEEQASFAMKAHYYMHHCQNADLAATRIGTIVMCECQGYFRKSRSMIQVRAYESWAELAAAYPLHYNRMMHFHTGLFLNLMTSMAKKLLPSKIAKRFVFGCKSPHGRLDEIYGQPSLPAANKRLLEAFDKALRLRFQNEDTFRL